MVASFRAAAAAARRHGDFYFAALLSEQTIVAALGKASSVWQSWLYTPSVTIWMFLSQCLSADHSCRDTVARLLAWRVSRGQRPCSSDTGAYCIARDRLPEDASRTLVCQTGQALESEAPNEWLWHQRRVRVVDGSTITMPDTPENQAEYPQQKNQKLGCGFPIARIIVVFSLAVGAVVEMALGKYQGKQTGENSMFRQLHESLGPGDVVLADRCFSGWFDLALLRQRQLDIVVRKHQRRATDFRTGQRLGQDDHLVTWSKPPRPKWMSPAEYAVLPDELTLREVRVQVKQRGFRTKSFVVVTTLLDAQEYPATDIADLFRRRWQAELCLRSLKIVLQMDHLRCKTPHRVRNEFYMHLLAYNLIRRAMVIAAVEAKVNPYHLSFKGTVQALDRFLPLLDSCQSVDDLCQALVACIATHVVGNRPDRYEPRLKKRRPKPYQYLYEPRANYKKRMR